MSSAIHPLRTVATQNINATRPSRRISTSTFCDTTSESGRSIRAQIRSLQSLVTIEFQYLAATTFLFSSAKWRSAKARIHRDKLGGVRGYRLLENKLRTDLHVPLQAFVAVEFQHLTDEVIEFPLHDLVELIESQPDTMICQAVLWEVVSPDAFAPVA